MIMTKWEAWLESLAFIETMRMATDRTQADFRETEWSIISNPRLCNSKLTLGPILLIFSLQASKEKKTWAI